MMTDKAVYFSQSLLQILCFFLRLPHFSVSLDNGIEQGENIVFVDFQPEIRAFLWVFNDVGVELDRSSGDPALGIIGGLDCGDKLPIFFHSWRTTYLDLSPPYGHPNFSIRFWIYWMRGDERRRGSKGTTSHPGHLQTRTQDGAPPRLQIFREAVSPAGQTSRSSDLISVTEELRDITRFGRFRAGGHAGPPLRNVVLFDFHVDDGAVWSASILPRRARANRCAAAPRRRRGPARRRARRRRPSTRATIATHRAPAHAAR